RVGTDAPGNGCEQSAMEASSNAPPPCRRERPPALSHQKLNELESKETPMLSTLFTNDVRQTLNQFRRSVDQMFDNFYGQTLPASSTASGERTWTFSPVLESGWNDYYLSLRAILPGVAEKDLTVS